MYIHFFSSFIKVHNPGLEQEEVAFNDPQRVFIILQLYKPLK